MFSKRKLVVLLAAMSATAMLAGCGEDAKSPTAVIDTAPPIIPANLTAASQNGVVSLTWQANVVDGDLSGYRIWRTVDSQSHSLVYEPQVQNQYQDRAPALECWSTYIVAAVDESNNESGYAMVRVYVGADRYTAICIGSNDESSAGEDGFHPVGAHDQRPSYRR